MRQISSGCLCSRADWPAWKGGWNQNQRSVGKSACILTSAIRNLSSKASPTKSSPSRPRVGERAPSQATTQSASSAVVAIGRRDGQRRAVIRAAATPVSRFDQRRSISGFCQRRVDQRRLDIVLLEVDEGRLLVAGLGQQVEAVERLVAVKDLAGPPGHALLDHRLGQAQPVEDLERALGEADRARALADAVGIVEQHAPAPAGAPDRAPASGRRTRADDDHRVARRAAAHPDRCCGDRRTGGWGSWVAVAIVGFPAPALRLSCETKATGSRGAACARLDRGYEPVAHLFEKPVRKQTINNRFRLSDPCGRRSGPGQMNRLASDSTIQDRSSSRPNLRLTAAGISTASEGSTGRLWVIGNTTTT